jgi:hypothetical protein
MRGEIAEYLGLHTRDELHLPRRTSFFHNFAYDREGIPEGGLVFDDAGNLYAQPPAEARAAEA